MKHIEHLEDLLLSEPNGFELVKKILFNIVNDVNIKIYEKVDGKPAIVFGREDNNDFFISTKSFYNKTPVKCYSYRDITEKFGENAKLANILTICSTELEKITPKGIYQAEFLATYDSVDCVSDKYKIFFQPNLIKYGLSRVFNLLNDVDLILCPHTTIIKNSGSDYDFKPINILRFDLSKSTFFVDNRIILDRKLESLFPKQWFYSHILGLDWFYQRAFYALDIFKWLPQKVKRGYFNFCLKNDISPTDGGWSKWLENKGELISFDTTPIIDLYTQIQICKRIVIDWLEVFANRTFDSYEINDMSANPEGYVVYTEDKFVKFVNRGEFSVKNFKFNGNND